MRPRAGEGDERTGPPVAAFADRKHDAWSLDVERQVAVTVVISMEESPLLVAVPRGGVQPDLSRQRGKSLQRHAGRKSAYRLRVGLFAPVCLAERAGSSRFKALGQVLALRRRRQAVVPKLVLDLPATQRKAERPGDQPFRSTRSRLPRSLKQAASRRLASSAWRRPPPSTAPFSDSPCAMAKKRFAHCIFMVYFGFVIVKTT